MDRLRVPGVIVVAVQDGELLYAQGFGVADLAEGTPMSPTQTVMRVGSISKLITATVVLKLCQEGLLDLRADLRTLLEPGVLQHYREPLTLHHLLTHSAGVGEMFAGQTVAEPNGLLPLKTHLGKRFPPPIAPPGHSIVYSNFGIALAGLSVEAATGQSLARSVEERILESLGMTNSGFLPTPDQVAAIPTGYNYIFGGYRELPLRHWQPYPASSFVATGVDLSKFMIEHLREDSGILNNETRRLMHRRQFTVHPEIPGIAYTFWERVENGRHILWHSGHMPGHRTGLYLLPEEQFGIMIYNNSEFRLFDSCFEDFLDHFFPLSSPAEEALQTPASPRENTRFAGTFRHTWYPRTSFAKTVALIGLQGHEIRVRPAANGTDLYLDSVLYQPIAANLFRLHDDDRLVAFAEDRDGEVSFLYRGGADAFHRLHWWETRKIQWILLVALELVFLASLILSTTRTLKGRRSPLRTRRPFPIRLCRISSGAISSIYLVFTLSMLSMAAAGAYEMIQEIGLPLIAILSFPLIACLFKVVFLIALTTAWKSPHLTRFDRAHFSILTLNSIAAIWFLHYWNLLGLRL